MVKGKNEWHFYIAWSCVVPGIGLKFFFFRIGASDSKNLQKATFLYTYTIWEKEKCYREKFYLL